MKKSSRISLLSFLTAMITLFTSMVCNWVPSVSAVGEGAAVLPEIPAITDESAIDYIGGTYCYQGLEMYTAEEAAAEGVPEGYSGDVLKVIGGSLGETGMVVDFTEWHIPVEEIRSMTIRYYVDADCRAIRLANNGQWLVNEANIVKARWGELTVTDCFDRFANNPDGTLGKVALCFRSGMTFYVDGIRFQLKDQPEDDTAGEKDYFQNPVGRDEIPYALDDRPIFGNYDYKSMAVYTEEEAAAAGVPTGYSGHVMKLTGTAEVGIAMDLTEWRIPLSLVESMTFRVYVPHTIKEVRLANTADFIVRYIPTQTNAWVDITLYPDGTGFNNYDFTDMMNPDQTLGAFHFCLRFNSGSDETGYVDGFSVKLKENDGVAPIVQYEGSTVIETTAEKPLFLRDLIAFDEQEDRYILPVLTWSEGAVDENGLMQKGQHTCVAVFKDYFGNSSEITLQVQVGDKDTQPPEIKFGLNRIQATVGTHVELEETIVVTDNCDAVTPVFVWSEGALDAYGRLRVGTHTLTITARDLTGLEAQKTVTFIVSDQADAAATPTPVK